MDTIHVLIAERSQLVRLGITGILYQIGSAVNIREIQDSERLKTALQKDHPNLLIISKSFLKQASEELICFLNTKKKSSCIILIDDLPELKMNLEFNVILDFHDTERSIHQKIENSIQRYLKPVHDFRFNEELSLREKEVLKLVALGFTNKEIGEKLFISSHTVITHRKNITAKLGIKTIAGLTVYAVINKLIAAEEIK